MNKKPYTRTFRVLHWAIALTMLFLALTIFLRLTWMNKFAVAEIINNYLSTSHFTLTSEELIVLAKQIRKPMWDWHIYTGYVLVGLFSLRFALGATGKMAFQNPFQKTLTLKELFQYWMYLVFYLCITVSLITGLLIELGPKSWKVSVEGIHKLSVYYLTAFIILHIGGVLFAELSNQKGIISAVISGNRTSS